MNFDLQKLIRPNIKKLSPYSSARQEFSGAARIFLDANENSFGSPLERNYHRYPDPLQLKIKEKLAALHNVKPDEIFLGNGSDEAIDLLFRIFCEPRRDNVLICPPTYGMYEVSAEINDIAVKRARLTGNFELDPANIERQIDENTKIIFICSPNNPTGNAFTFEKILNIAKSFAGIIVIDEAYIHFSSEKSFVPEINNLPNIVVLQTFSKAWGLAGLRVGTAFADRKIIELFNKVKPPYNISGIAQETILKALENVKTVNENIRNIIFEREKLKKNLQNLSFVKRIFPTDANFILVKASDAKKIYNFLLEQNIVVRNRHNVELCENCLRITIGTPEENQILFETLAKFGLRDSSATEE